MSKRIEYKCDLCKEIKTKELLTALYWKCDIIPQRYVLNDFIDSCDKHICTSCIHLIKDYNP